MNLLDRGGTAHLFVLVHRDDAVADVIAVLDIFGRKAAAAHTYLNGTFGINQPFLVTAAHESRMVDLVATDLIQRIGVGIEMQYANRLIDCECPQDRQWNGVVATARDRHNVCGFHLAEKILDHVDRLIFAHRIHRRIAQIGNVADLKRPDSAGRMHPPDESGHLPDSGRAMPGAGAVVETQIKGHPHQSHIHLLDDLLRDGTHEGGQSRKPRHHRGVDRLIVFSLGHNFLR